MNEGFQDENEFSDPFLDEVHRLKRDAFRRSGDNWERHFARLREIEKQWRESQAKSPVTTSDPIESSSPSEAD